MEKKMTEIQNVLAVKIPNNLIVITNNVTDNMFPDNNTYVNLYLDSTNKNLHCLYFNKNNETLLESNK